MSEEEANKITEVTQPPPKTSKISPIQKYTAELIGTMVLVLMGCGSAVIAGHNLTGGLAGNGIVGISLAFGISVLVMVYAIGPISGCHINPAISISMLVAGKISAKDTAFYVVFQCVGAIIGAGILYAIAMGKSGFNAANLGQNGFGIASPSYNGVVEASGYNWVSALIAEIVLTFIFLLVIFGSTSDRAPKGFAGISIGLTLVLIHLVAIPIDGTSVNPARSLGPALFAGLTQGSVALSQLWLFIVAPIVGGIIAAVVWKLFK